MPFCTSIFQSLQHSPRKVPRHFSSPPLRGSPRNPVCPIFPISSVPRYFPIYPWCLFRVHRENPWPWYFRFRPYALRAALWGSPRKLVRAIFSCSDVVPFFAFEIRRVPTLLLWSPRFLPSFLQFRARASIWLAEVLLLRPSPCSSLLLFRSATLVSIAQRIRCETRRLPFPSSVFLPSVLSDRSGILEICVSGFYATPTRFVLGLEHRISDAEVVAYFFLPRAPTWPFFRLLRSPCQRRFCFRPPSSLFTPSGEP
jgi:hypothetical protein